MEVFTEKLCPDLDKNIEMMDRLLHYGDSFDLIKRIMTINGTRLIMYYIDGFVKGEEIQRLMLHFVTLKDFGDGSPGAAQRFADGCVPSAEVDVTDSVDSIITMVLSGCTAMFSEGFGAECIIIDARTYPARQATEPENDRVMRGSRDGFVETLIFNTAMLRRRIRDPRMTVQYISGGRSSRTDLALCYMKDKADTDYVKLLTKKLENMDADSLTMGHESIAETLIRKRWYNPFPKIRTTERPDAAAASVLEGDVILLCDNSPEAMIFPTSIFDFLQETDDYYFPPLTGTYLRIVRQIVFWLTMFVTPIWYLLLMHEAVLPEWMRFIVPSAPGDLPIILQLYLTEFMIDGLKLASMNTSSALSNSLSVVGGLILGEFAVEVGWLCSDVILYMAFVSIANFTQSSYELGYAFKFMRMILLLLTALFSTWGFVGGVLLVIILIATNKTVNGKRSYLYPFIPFDGRALARLVFRLKKRN